MNSFRLVGAAVTLTLPLALLLSAGGVANASTTDDSSSLSVSPAPTDSPATTEETVSSFVPAAAGTATYYPSGPQQNVPQADLAGWELCYTDLYGDNSPLYGTGGILDELCTGDYLLIAGAPVGSTTLTLLATAPRADVVFATPADTDTVHVANGAAWYFNDGLSWGFLQPGDLPDKDECDVRTDGANDLRLCWHLTGQELTGGYRLGSIEGLNSSTDYARFVYHAAEVAVAPEELATTGSGLELFPAAGFAALALAIGVGVLGAAAARHHGRQAVRR